MVLGASGEVSRETVAEATTRRLHGAIPSRTIVPDDCWGLRGSPRTRVAATQSGRTTSRSRRTADPTTFQMRTGTIAAPVAHTDGEKLCDESGDMQTADDEQHRDEDGLELKTSPETDQDAGRHIRDWPSPMAVPMYQVKASTCFSHRSAGMSSQPWPLPSAAPQPRPRLWIRGTARTLWTTTGPTHQAVRSRRRAYG